MMTKRTRSLLAVGLALAGGPVVVSQQPPDFPAKAELVLVDAIVVDKAGQAVRGLEAKDFTVREDGVAQSVASFEAVSLAPAPDTPPPPSAVSTNVAPAARGRRVFAVVYDAEVMSFAEGVRAREAVVATLKAASADGDVVSLVVPGKNVWWSEELPAGLERFLPVLKRLTQPVSIGGQARTTGGNAPLISANGGNSLVVAPPEHSVLAIEKQAHKQALVDTMVAVLDSLAEVRGYKTLLVVSPDLDYVSGPTSTPDDSRLNHRAILAASQRANAAITVLDVRGLVGGVSIGAGAETSDSDFSSLADAVASDTGGLTLRNRNDLGAGAAGLVAQSSSYYVLGYRPAADRSDGRYHAIDVRVAREGVTVRARKGYVAGSARVGAGEAPRAMLERAMSNVTDLPGVPARLATYALPHGAKGTVAVLVVAEAQATQGRVNFHVAAFERDSGETTTAEAAVDAAKETAADGWLRRRQTLHLKPGVYKLKLLVEDEATKRIGTVVRNLEVPKLDGLLLSAPLVTDTMLGRLPAPVAQTTFAAGRPLYALVETRPGGGGAHARVAASYEVRRRTGEVAIKSTAVALHAQKEGSLAGGWGMLIHEPGEYEIAVRVQDEAGASRETRQAFVLRP